MKAIITSIIVLSVIVVSGQDIRGNNWGDSIEEVKLKEGDREWGDGVTDTGSKYTSTSTKIGGLDAVIGWYFIENKLFMVAYVFTEEHQNRNLFISDFDSIKEILDEKYGVKKTETIWYNSLYKNDVEDYGLAISIGHMARYTSRENDRTTIEHVLNGDNYEIKHGVTYRSKELKSLAGSKKRDKNLKDF